MKTQLIEKQIHFAGCNVSYLIGGPITATPPILFVHGWGVSVEPYQEMLSLLAQRYRVIAPYLPNLGKTTGPKSVWNYDDYTQFLIDFINILNLEKVHLMGHSLGGGISAQLSATLPGVVSSLVLIDSTGIPSGTIPTVLPRRLVEMLGQMPQARLPQLQQIFQAFTYNCFFHLQNVAATLKVALEGDLKPLLPQIQAPCLLLWGGQDLTTPLSVAQEFLGHIPNSQLVVVDEGFHEWNLFLVEKSSSIILNFLDGIEAKPQVGVNLDEFVIQH
ncbi:alpha/beta fold hydrolase [Trichocoleus sp. FACHB-262]|uniref:alpha/beta fold hydrolase n=1 Tax=Trichocoleus sp. FACHB-262 TaxID=2692869 RepID=UPI00168442A0|nr:alpha/beta hydrolase [Trichocoleus sp. FACHB-262]MBD2124344.1 alpha/beta hydrolase [Trichocoleus sp. FACHB-262]